MALDGLNLQKIQQGDEDEFKRVFERFGCVIEPRPTFECVKYYPFEKLLPEKASYQAAEAIIQIQLATRNWYYKIFGPDERGHGFKTPKFAEHNYKTRCIWIFQPHEVVSAGSVNPAFNLLWSVSHELAHAYTNDDMTIMFGGEGKRRGALGIETVGNTFSNGHGKQKPLNLADALRATEWEHHATLLQRRIVEEDYGLIVSDDDFLREYQYNVAGSVIRTLCGQFTTPGALGVVPKIGGMNPAEMNQLAQDIYRDAAEKMGMDMKGDYR